MSMPSIPGSGSTTGVAVIGIAELIAMLFWTTEGTGLRNLIFTGSTTGKTSSGKTPTSAQTGIPPASTVLKDFGIATVAVVVAVIIAGTSQSAAKLMFYILLALGFVFLLTHITGKQIMPGLGTQNATITTIKGGKS